MTKKETMQYKRAAKEACTAYGIKVYMKDMILLESGISNGIIDYVLFRDAKTGKEYSCAYGIKYYNAEFDTCWDVMVSDPEATEPEHTASENQPTADRYLDQVEQADSLDELDTITETAANDDTISTAEYERIHAAALRKAQGWDPQNKPQETTQQETPSRKRYFVKRGDFGNVYSLFWADSPEMEEKLPDGAERITRAEAIKLCRDERQRRKHDRAFAYYADAQVYPAGYPDDSDISADRRYTLSGYIWERTNEAVSV